MKQPMPPPHQNARIFGHEQASEQISTAFQSGRMHHALMITGAEGIGKTTLAFHIANYIMSGGQNKIGHLDLSQPVARLIAAESHPDLFTLCRAVDDKSGEPKENIATEEARQVAPFLRMTATHGNWRVVIIDEAHLLNRFGQNSILKIVEEPPRNTLIILTTTSAGALLPTIRSRCSVLNLQPLTAHALQQALEHLGINLSDNADHNERVLALSSGSLGFLLKLLDTDAIELFDNLQELLRSHDLNYTKLYQLADRVGRKADNEQYKVLCTLIDNHLRSEIVTRTRAGGRIVPQKLQLWDHLNGLFTQTEHARLDRKLAFIQAVTQMRAAA